MLANTRTDAIIFTTKAEINPHTLTNLSRTGLTIENGDLWVWGYRNKGLQGNGDKKVSRKEPPARIEYFVEKGLSITQVAGGTYHIIALDDRGDVWGWGRDIHKEASGGKYTGHGHYPSLPVLVLENQDIIQISCGKRISYALTRSGEVYFWGDGHDGESGTGIHGGHASKVALTKIPSGYFDNRPVVKIGAGYDSGYAINDAGTVFAWGDEERDSFGEVNHKAHVKTPIPKQIKNLDGIDGKDIVHITGGNAFTVFLTSSGRVYGMGKASRLGVAGPYDDDDDDDDIDEDDDDDDEDDNNDDDDDDDDDKELTPEEIEHENQKREGEKKGKTIAKPVLITRHVSSVYCRFRGCVAITNHNRLVTWGHKGGPYKNIMYGRNPTERDYLGHLTKIDVGKQHIFYWNDEGEAFGVGSGGGHKFNLGTNKKRDWPGYNMTSLVDAMKGVYGQDYIPGQGYDHND
ncbi:MULTISPECIES: RCC1 domain-containing protein [unclassified Gilliamella]|uniref:RCC1 domain-containing protein n=1 Tax=unclassified Gilliamella TaxID=2685620 RepID=UPI00159EC31E|nr:hypothetical protein [Gilliamella apicola]